MRFLCLLVASLILVGLVTTPRAEAAPVARTAGAKFVGVRATAFVLDSKPFHFLGANVAVMHGPTERRRYRRTLRAARTDGLTVVRVWALGEGPANASRWLRRWHLFRAGPKGWISAAPRHLDKVLAHAKHLGLRVILTLANKASPGWW